MEVVAAGVCGLMVPAKWDGVVGLVCRAVTEHGSLAAGVKSNCELSC